MDRLRILLLTAYFPWHGHGGGLLIGNLIRELAHSHEVTLLTYIEPGEKDFLPEVEALCRVVTVPFAEQSNHFELFQTTKPSHTDVFRRVWRQLPGSWRSRFYEVRRLPGLILDLQRASLPQEVAARQTVAFEAALLQVLRSQSFDVILTEWPEMAPLFSHLPSEAVRVFDTIELRSLTYWRHFRYAQSLEQRIHWFTQWRKMQHLEAVTTGQFDVVSAVSRREAQYLKRYRGSARIISNPIGLDLTNWPREDVGPRWENTLIYLGRMSYAPNQDAMRYFLTHVYPQVRRQEPEARLMIVGGNPPADIQERDGQDGIVVTGFVPDVAEYLSKGSIFILPMRQGAGIKVKALEAMAAGIPVVTSPEGIEGLDEVLDERDVLIAKTARNFVDKLVRLLRDADLQKCLADHARQRIWKCYNAETNVQVLARVYGEMYSKKASG